MKGAIKSNGGQENRSAKAYSNILLKKGFDEKMGARPLARVIDNDIKTPLGRKLLFEDHKKGTVNITVKDKELDLVWQS